MKKLVIALALLGALTSCSYAADAPIKDTGTVSSVYDPSADLTTVQSREVKIAIGKRSVTSQASFSYPGKSPSRPKEITFRLSTYNMQAVWGTLDGFIYFKAGDKIVKVPAQRMGGGMGGTSIEILTAQIPVDTFATLLSATTLTILLQHKENPPFEPAYQENYPFDEASLTPFRELLESIPSTVQREKGTVSSVYDPSADSTKVDTSEINVDVGIRSVTSQARFSYPGKVPVRPKEVSFRLTIASWEDVWATADDNIYFKAGGKVVKVPMHSSGGFGTGTQSYRFRDAQVPVDTFASIFSAKSVTIMLQHEGHPPFEPAFQENYPFDAASLAPFRELVKSIPSTVQQGEPR